ncbi:hypothetical protein [Nostoc sp. C110]|uniref:hypothetical protein n=1 Tax=Nostoc sp. C110 TaxID=3349876 RepID=UPI00370D7183
MIDRKNQQAKACCQDGLITQYPAKAILIGENLVLIFTYILTKYDKYEENVYQLNMNIFQIKNCLKLL